MDAIVRDSGVADDLTVDSVRIIFLTVSARGGRIRFNGASKLIIPTHILAGDVTV